jgi:FSR family fosmidomycin resistance protein-like MFS transporter
MTSPSAPPAVAAEAARTTERDFQAGPVLTLSTGHAIHDTYTAFLAPLLPLFIENLGISIAAAGMLRVFIQWPSLVQPWIGRLADRRDLRLLVVLAPALSAAVMSLVGVANSYAMLAVFLLIVGFSSAGLHAVGPVLAGLASGRSLGRGMSFWMVGGELGRTLGPMIVVAAVQILGLQGLPWLMTAGLLASGLLYLQLRRIPSTARGGVTEANWWPVVRGMGPLLLPLSGFVVARSFLIEPLTTYLPVFMHSEGAALWLAGASLTVVEAAGVVGALFSGSLSDRLGRHRVLMVLVGVGPALMLLFLAATVWGGAAGIWLQFPLLLLLGLTQVSITPVIMALVQESYPENRALANGAYMALSFALRSLVTPAVGALGDVLGLRLAFAIGALIQLLALPLVLRLPRNGSPR